MINHLKSLEIIGDQNGENLVLLMLKIDPENPSGSDIFVAKMMLEHLASKGFAIFPFLKAVRKYPNKNKMIQVKTVDYGPEFGFYNLREGDDVSAAMRNFAAFLGLMKKPYGKRGIYELSRLGKKSLEFGADDIIRHRIKCNKGEPCREICPTNAISLDIITNACIECGLCTKVCPYGAIELDCKEKIVLNTEICQANNGNPISYPPCDIRPIQAEEVTMQNWIRAIMNLTNLPAEIPGIGEYPDIVTAEIPSFIEVKKTKLTIKRVQALLDFQLPRYMKKEVIERTIARLKERKGFTTNEPDFFIVVAPKNNVVEEFLIRAKEKQLKYPISFISSEALYKLSEQLLVGKKVNSKKAWEAIEPWKDCSELLLSDTTR